MAVWAGRAIVAAVAGPLAAAVAELRTVGEPGGGGGAPGGAPWHAVVPLSVNDLPASGMNRQS